MQQQTVVSFAATGNDWSQDQVRLLVLDQAYEQWDAYWYQWNQWQLWCWWWQYHAAAAAAMASEEIDIDLAQPKSLNPLAEPFVPIGMMSLDVEEKV